MKRTFTILSLCAVTLSATAQTPGYTATSLYDDFATTVVYTDPNPTDTLNPDGGFWWGKSATGVDPNAPTNTDQCFLDHKTAITRSGSGKMDVVVTQGNKCWQPMGVSTKLDLSNNATFEIEVTNNSSTVSVYFNVSLSDESKNVLNANSSKANYALTSIAPGETKILSGDFTGGYYKAWPGPVYTQTFDYSKVVGLDLTFVNATQPETNAWEPEPITDVSVSVNYVKIGTGTAQSVNTNVINDFTMYPNPNSGDQLNFSTQLASVQVFNSLGQLLLSESNTSTVNIAGLTTGVYVVRTDLGTKKLYVK